MKNKIMIKAFFLYFMLISGVVTYAQVNPDFTFNLKFSTNYHTEVDGQEIGQQHLYELKNHETFCTFLNVDYHFKKKDTLLFRYFKEFQSLFEQTDFERHFWRTIGSDDFMTVDGVTTFFSFQSETVKKEIEIRDHRVKDDSLYDSIMDNFFNIACYLVKQPTVKRKLSAVQLAVLESDESIGRMPVRFVHYNPTTYRLKERVLTYSNTKVMDFFKNLPTDRKTFIEVGGMFHVNEYDLFTNEFRDFVKTSSNIIWIPDNNWYAEELLKLGVKEEDIK